MVTFGNRLQGYYCSYKFQKHIDEWVNDYSCQIRIYRVSGYFRLVSLSFHEYSVANLNIKNFMSPTPLNCVLKALIFALKDSAEAFVNLSWK